MFERISICSAIEKIMSGGAAVLFDAAVHRQFQADILRIRNGRSRHESRTHRAAGVVRLTRHPIELVEGLRRAVMVARGEVDADGVAGDMGHRIFGLHRPRLATDHGGELDFPVERLGPDRHMDGRALADHRVARRLEEEEQPLRFLARIRDAHLLDVIVVVGARAQHLAGVEQRRKPRRIDGTLSSARTGFSRLVERRPRSLPVGEQVDHGRHTGEPARASDGPSRYRLPSTSMQAVGPSSITVASDQVTPSAPVAIGSARIYKIAVDQDL